MMLSKLTSVMDNPSYLLEYLDSSFGSRQLHLHFKKESKVIYCICHQNVPQYNSVTCILVYFLVLSATSCISKIFSNFHLANSSDCSCSVGPIYFYTSYCTTSFFFPLIYCSSLLASTSTSGLKPRVLKNLMWECTNPRAKFEPCENKHYKVR